MYDVVVPNRQGAGTYQFVTMRLLLFLAVPLFAQTPCAEMGRLRNVIAATQTATYCRVSITLRPAADSEI